VRAASLRALSTFGPDALPALEKSKAALKDPDSFVRAAAAFTLGAMGPKASSAVPMLTEAMKGADPATGTGPQESAARALGAFGALSKSALPTMMSVLKETTSSGLRRALLDAAIEVGPAAAPEIPKLLAVAEEFGTWHVQTALASMGDKMGKAAAPQLGKLLSDKSDKPVTKEYVRRGALAALGKIGKDASSEVPQIAKLLKDAGIRYYAVTALEAIGPGAAAAVDPLVELVDKNLDRYQALRALAKIGAPSVAPLTKLMVDPTKEKYFRSTLPRAVLECGPGAAKSTLAVLETMEELGGYDLQSFRYVGKAAVPPLQAATKSAKPGIRKKAVTALGYLGPDASRDAILALLTVMKTPELRGVAISAIERHGKVTAQPILTKILEDKSKTDLHGEVQEVLKKTGW
jgi:HEAT repeat protein